MEADDFNRFHFYQKNYFRRFKLNEHEQSNKTSCPINKHVRHALEYFVDDLKQDLQKTIDRFLTEEAVDEIFISIAQLLSCDDNRICGNSAYIIGSVVEVERGLKQFLYVFTNNDALQVFDIIQALCQMLTHADSDCVLNATGTLGTISGTKEGREFILKHSCVSQMVFLVSTLLNSNNMWIANNAALVLARLTVEETGCQIILSHSRHSDILNQLLAALDVSDPSRSTNIAFAIARLIEGEVGKKILINDCGKTKFFEALLIMLEINEDKGINKNACYALSCLCSSQYGYQLCIESVTLFHQILLAIETILLSTEHEAVWFALMCLTTIAKYDEANEHLCYSKNLLGIIKEVQKGWTQYKDIQDESRLLWFMLQKHIKPQPPKIDECGVNFVNISWEPCLSIDEPNENQYRILLDNVPLTTTNLTNHLIDNLKSNTGYQVKIQYITTHGESVPSDPTEFHTQEELPPSVINLRVIRTTTTVIRIAWQQPDLSACPSFKGYKVYLNSTEHESLHGCESTITSLIPSTSYQVEVCAVSSRGEGSRVSINAKTDSAGDFLPGTPTFPVVGRRELHIKWQAPEVTCGRFSRYELICNGRCIYSGLEHEYHATKLRPDTDYNVEVVAITQEGRFRSRPARARTLKDEFLNNARYSVYERPTPTPTKFKNPGEGVFLTQKISPNVDKRLAKEVPVINQNVQITTVRSLQLKTDLPSYSRALPGLFRNIQTRPNRTIRRSKTDTSLQQISAAVIIPTLDIHHNTRANHSSRTKAYRYPVVQRSFDRSPTLSLADSILSFRRLI